MDYKVPGAADKALQRLRDQRQEGVLCDVNLLAGDRLVPAHSCVLAACSEYFHRIFAGSFMTPDFGEVHLPIYNATVVEKVVDLIYTGTLTLEKEELEDALILADFLCMDELVQACSKTLQDHLNEDNCINLWHLAKRYCITELLGAVSNFILPRVSTVFRRDEIRSLDWGTFGCLMRDPQMSLMSEGDKTDTIMRWIENNKEKRLNYLPELARLVEPKYLSLTHLKYLMKGTTVMTDDEHFSNRCASFLRVLEARGTEGFIICRSRISSLSDHAALVAYNTTEDKWYKVKVPYPNFADQVVSMTVHDGDLYVLVTTTEDLFGYMHPVIEKKDLWLLDTTEGLWVKRASTQGIPGRSRIFSHTSGLYTVDQEGGVAYYRPSSNSWHLLGEQGFTRGGATCYYVPMPIGDRIYVLRAECSSPSLRTRLTLHLFNTATHEWNAISDTDTESLGLSDSQRLHGYVIHPGGVILRNEFGKPRVKFDFTDLSWSAYEQEEQPPGFVHDIWGTVDYMDKVYWIGRTTDNEPCFLMYDIGANKLKAVAPPSCHLSGIACFIKLSHDAQVSVII